MTTTTKSQADATSLETTYRDLRDRLRDEYDQRVGPRAVRCRLRAIDRYRDAGADRMSRRAPHHSCTADRLERELENDEAQYRAGAAQKHVLAVLTGRYDLQLIATGSSGSYSDEDLQRQLRTAEKTRISQISEARRAEIQAQLAASEASAARRRQRMLDCPPIGWGSSYTSCEERVARWRGRPENDRLSDPRERQAEEVAS